MLSMTSAGATLGRRTSSSLTLYSTSVHGNAVTILSVSLGHLLIYFVTKGIESPSVSGTRSSIWTPGAVVTLSC